MSAVAKGLEGENQTLKSEIIKLKLEIQDCKKENQDSFDKTAEIRVELEKFKNLYSQKLHETNIEINQFKTNSCKEKSKDEAVLREEKIKNSKLNLIISHNQTLIKDLQQELVNKDQALIVKIKEAREEEWTKVSKSEFEKQELDQEIFRLNTKISDMEYQSNLVKKDLENVFLINVIIRKFYHLKNLFAIYI